MRGALRGTHPDTAVPGFTGEGYVTGFDKPYFGVVVMAQSCINRPCCLKVRVNTPGDPVRMKALLNDVRSGARSRTSMPTTSTS